MRSYSFGLIVSGADFGDDDVVNALYEAGVEDVSFAVRDGSSVAYVDRDAASYPDALTASIQELEAALPGLKVCGIHAQDLVTPTGAAVVTHRTRQNVHQHIQGQRGAGFPVPLTWADRDRPLWLLGDVCRWSAASDPPDGVLERAATADDDDFHWPSIVGGVFHLLRASCSHERNDMEPALDLLLERYLALSPADPDARHRLGEHLRLLADRVEADRSARA